MDNYAIHGLDISHHQGDIDWEKVGNLDYDFVFVKATEGITHQDVNFTENWNALSQTTLKKGAYHYFRPNVSPIKQVENFLNLVPLKSGDLPPVLDVETDDGRTQEEVIETALEWLEEMEKRTCVKPILYTYQKFYNQYFKEKFAEYPIWIARYSTEKPELINQAEWDFWQYGNRGQIEGIDGFVDFNVFAGDSTDLAGFLMDLEETP